MAGENRKGSVKIMYKPKRNKIRVFTLCSLLFAMFALSCQSAPKVADVLPDSESIPLDQGALAYSFIDIRNARPILDHVDFMGMNDKDFQQILDRTLSAIIAVYAPQNKRRFQLIGWGNFPSSGAKMAFGASKSWKKMRSPTKAVYWYSAIGQISVALTSKLAFVLAVQGNESQNIQVDPFPTQNTAIPEGFNAFRQNAIFSCWFDDPSYIKQKLEEMGLPLTIAIEQLFVSLSPIADQTEPDEPILYQALLKIQVPGAIQARAMIALITIAQRIVPPSDIFDDNGAKDSSAVLKYLLLSNPPVQDGKNIFFKTNALTTEETALLFAQLLL
jgi:hypothetical protein